MPSAPLGLEFVASVGPGIDVEWVETDGLHAANQSANKSPLGWIGACIADWAKETLCITVRKHPSLPSMPATSRGNCQPSSGWACSERSEGGKRIFTFKSGVGAEKDPDDDKESKDIEKVKRNIRDLSIGNFDEITTNLDTWLKAPHIFFGEQDRSSNEQWSFESLLRAEEKYPGRIPFHKLNLALHLRRRIKSFKGTLHEDYFIEINCRKDMLKECRPNYGQLDGKVKESVTRMYNRYVEQGHVLMSMWTICPGLVLLIAPFLTRDDLQLVKTHLDDFSSHWLPPDVKEKAQRCETLAYVILRYAQGTSVSLAQSKRKADTFPSERSKWRQQASAACPEDRLEESMTETNLRLQNFIPNRSISDTMPVLCPSVVKEPVHTTGHSNDSSMPLLPETFIPPLFYAMGGHVPKIMIDYATSPQRRLCESGDVFEVLPHDAGLHQDLVDILSDKEGLLQSIERLILLSMIAVETSADGVFGSLGKKMLCVLQNLLDSFAQKGLKIPPNDDAVETLLAASRLCNLSSRRQLLTTAAKLQKDPVQVHLRAEIVHQQSVLLRFEGKIDESQRVIKDFFDGQYLTASHPLLGLLHLSQANNLVYNFQFPDAHEQAKTWQLLTSTPTKRQLDVLWEQIYLAGRIFRGEGRFEDAKECFQRCLSASGVPESKRILIKSTLADLYCELHYQPRTMPDTQYLDIAKHIIRSEIDRIRAQGLHSKGFRRLLLSSIEVEINQGQHSEAERLIKEVLAIYDKITEPDIVDRLGHVRALIALARISSPPEAEGRWSAALRQNAAYNPFEEEVFTCAVIYLFLSFVRFELKRIDQSKEAFSHARDIIGKRRPQLLIPGIGTYLFDYILLRLQSVAGYQLEVEPLA